MVGDGAESSRAHATRHTHAHTNIIQQDGDTIVVDAEKRVMDLVGVSEADLAARRAAWVAPPLKATNGTLYKFIKNVSTASEGCVTDA